MTGPAARGAGADGARGSTGASRGAGLRRRDGRAPAGQVWHFSEDPGIRRFVPHVAKTATHAGAYVWACSPERCPDYWFGRQTPRAMAWRAPGADPVAADRLLGRGVQRLHVIEHSSVAAMSSTELYAYPFDAAGFRELEGFAQVSEVEQVPLGPPIPLASPWELHAHAGMPVLVVPNLFPWWERVMGSGLGFSGIRLRMSPNEHAWGGDEWSGTGQEG